MYLGKGLEDSGKGTYFSGFGFIINRRFFFEISEKNINFIGEKPIFMVFLFLRIPALYWKNILF